MSDNGIAIDDGAVQISDIDLARVRELKRLAVVCLTEMNQILAPYMDVDPAQAASVCISLFQEPRLAFDQVPPVYVDPVHTVYDSNGGCIYQTVDPPGISRPCPAQ